MLTSALEDEIEVFKTSYGIDYEVYNADDIVLKTMIRSNPGLILFKDGVVIDKWHYHNLPDFQTLKEKYLE